MNNLQKLRIFHTSNRWTIAVFITIGISMLIDELGNLFGSTGILSMGAIAKSLMSTMIGFVIPIMFGADGLVIFSTMIASCLGAGAMYLNDLNEISIAVGNPIDALTTALVATYFGKRLMGKVVFDIIIVPLGIIIVVGSIGFGLSKFIDPIFQIIGQYINQVTEGNPLLLSIILSIVWGFLTFSPILSVALAIALDLNGLAGGAALAGCVAQFVGLAAISNRENDLKSSITLSICTPAILLPNILENAWIVLPSLVSSVVAGVISTLLFHIEVGKGIVGIGLCALVTPISLLSEFGIGMLIPMIVTYLLVPIFITYTLFFILKKQNLIRRNDLVIQKQFY
ncbi:PTS sugar transporter subunit IIC [Bacillus sp. RG28]|uniref:PTS sugar transporter subunit IIC n=2 Tax=Gottfriedia endophytica TaxID=2820819 RepID=A0A940NMC4_9BACI|nr:PTS sugar transporter subunit IIC [Gottfriedia endophytica]